MKKKLEIVLLVGAVYIYCVAVLHFIGIKIPPFYIYYDVQSTIYQDRIISILSFSFATFMFARYKLKTKEIVTYIIFAGVVGVIGLFVNNYLTLNAFRNNQTYWIEITFLALYIGVLYYQYHKYIKSINEK